MKQLIFLLFLFTVALSISIAQPITNVIAIQKDSLVEITYNWEGDFPTDISLYCCEKDGEEFKGPLVNVTGDVGLLVKPGTKKITWNVLKDQDILVGSNIIFRVKGITNDGKFIDGRDGNTYKTIKIGNQIWMSENIGYNPKMDGYFPYDRIKSNVTKYGYLYKWKVAMSVCPSGWHLPSKDEYDKLIFNILYTYKQNSSNPLLIDGDSGFSVLLGGWRTAVVEFKEIDIATGFWTSTEVDKYNANFIYIDNKASSIYPGAKDHGFYVRCVKD
jgi:uncharacterized protein (TIGR02145 family)